MTGEALPKHLGPYAIEGVIGRGGLGVVLRGRHPDGRAVAIKVLPRAGSAKRLARFEREHLALGKLDHPNVVRLIDSGAGPPPYIVMDLIAGKDLAHAIAAERRLAPERAARLGAEIASALAHAHALGIVHRDLKPGNVIVRASDDRAIVVDLGLAKDLGADTLTESGLALGTFIYAAPEQLRDSSRVGPEADAWALGALLYECVCGEPPFQADTVVELVKQIDAGRVVRPRDANPLVPPWLEETILACLQWDPALRPAAHEVEEALREQRPPRRPAPRSRARRRAAVAALGLALIVIAAAAILVLRSRTRDHAIAPPSAPRAPVEAPSGWRRVWSLDARPATVERPALWEDARTASPLRGARTEAPAALAAAFLGSARRLEGGRVAVVYAGADLRAALRPHSTVSPRAVQRANAETAAVLDDPAGVAIEAPNDMGFVFAPVGDALWSAPRAVVHASAQAIDITALGICVGGVPAAYIALEGRSHVAVVGSTTAPFSWGPSERRIGFAPGAEERSRVTLDGTPVSILAASAAEMPRPGPVCLRLSEGRFAFSRIEIEGVPLRADVPARADAPVDLPTSCQIHATFTREDEGGGPLVGVGGPNDAFVLELDAGRAILRHGRTILATASAGGARRAGSLLLRRDGPHLVGTVATPGESTLRLEAVEPLPLAAAPARAFFGSAGARVTFGAVEVHAGPASAELAALDQAAREGLGAALAAVRAQTPGAATSWRTGALVLARAWDPYRADYVALPTPESRFEAIAEARERLLEAAGGLPESTASDALARALVASVLLGRPADEVRELAQRLVALGPRATATFDGLEREHEPGGAGAPILIDRMLRGYELLPYQPASSFAATVVGEVMAPDRRAHALLARGAALRGFPFRDQRRAAALEEALRLLDEAAALETPGVEVDGERAQVLAELGRGEEAAAAWGKHLERVPSNWFGHFRRGDILMTLGRHAEALESLLRGLSETPGMLKSSGGVSPDGILRLSVAAARSHPGLAATALLVLREMEGNTIAPDLLEARASELVALTTEDERDADLLEYARARLGQAPPRRKEMRPIQILALLRTTGGSPEVRRKLIAQAAAIDSFARSLARLDPLLRDDVR